jgi:hypothetical protein
MANRLVMDLEFLASMAVRSNYRFGDGLIILSRSVVVKCSYNPARVFAR